LLFQASSYRNPNPRRQRHQYRIHKKHIFPQQHLILYRIHRKHIFPQQYLILHIKPLIRFPQQYLFVQSLFRQQLIRQKFFVVPISPFRLPILTLKLRAGLRAKHQQYLLVP